MSLNVLDTPRFIRPMSELSSFHFSHLSLQGFRAESLASATLRARLDNAP